MDRYRAAFEADPEAVDRWRTGVQFEYANDRLVKVRCVECGADGYPGSERPNPWQLAHLLGHAPCAEGCGRRFSVRWDGTARTHGHHRHACPGPKETR
jgi:hypothetical protein